MDMLVLAGGFGTRLRDVVNDVPKPMAPINGVPLIQLQLDHWILQGQESFIFLLHHRAQMLIDLLVKRSKYYGNGINIDWIVEDTPLGTGGSVLNAINLRALKGSVLIANADTWLDCGLKEIRNNKSAVIGAIKVTNTARYGSMRLDNESYVIDFVEKQISPIANAPGIINAGLYKIPTELFVKIGRKEFAIETEILPQLTCNKLLYAEILEGSFFDIGVPQDYYKFCDWHRLRKKNHGYS